MCSEKAENKKPHHKDSSNSSSSSHDHEVVHNPEVLQHAHATDVLEDLHTHDTALIVRLDKSVKLSYQATLDSSGFDVHSTITTSIPPGQRRLVPLGICVRLPDGCYTPIASRSSLAIHHGLIVNGGVIDHGYTGELHALMINISRHTVIISHGDRICPMIFERNSLPIIIETHVLPSTIRSEGAFGSTSGFKASNPPFNYLDDTLLGSTNRIKLLLQPFCLVSSSLTCFLYTSTRQNAWRTMITLTMITTMMNTMTLQHWRIHILLPVFKKQLENQPKNQRTMNWKKWM
jgi:dUTP pyrophosphatase